MTTRSQTIDKIKEMILNLDEMLETEVKRLIVSGGIDLDDETAPKVVLHVALKNIADQYRPLSAGGKKAASNLLHF